MSRQRGDIFWIDRNDPPETFPPVSTAKRDPNGLLAAGGDLQPERLIAAYQRGIFPWYSEGQPIMWWSPDPRALLLPENLKVTRSLRQSIRKHEFESRIDHDFAAVMAACGDPQFRDGTWITDEMRAAYYKLHQLGYAHSVETWQRGTLIGGLYGVQLGKVFFGESMFSRVTDASKFALKCLCEHLIAQGVVMIDCQMATSHLLSLGAQLIPRTTFVTLLEKHIN
jgi:leucyl/phenylalanyl-tRNA--protein transferase